MITFQVCLNQTIKMTTNLNGSNTVSSIQFFTNGSYQIGFGNQGLPQLIDLPSNLTFTDKYYKWVQSMDNHTLAAYWSPSFWSKQYFGFALGIGLYWNGS